jgi:hypothetical protein
MDSNQELALCYRTEKMLSAEYGMTSALTDNLCVIALDNAAVALKHHFGYAKNETVRSSPVFDGVVAGVVEIGLESIGQNDTLTLKAFLAAVIKVKKSIIRHSAYGSRAYYDFIQDYV